MTRAVFWPAAAFNFAVAAALVWPGNPAWTLLGVEYPAQPLFVNLFALFVALFGFAYFWIGIDPAGKRALILFAAAGKLSMVLAAGAHWLAGLAPAAVFALSLGDLAFAILFVRIARRLPQ